jgi:hypothetical protein
MIWYGNHLLFNWIEEDSASLSSTIRFNHMIITLLQFFIEMVQYDWL